MDQVKSWLASKTVWGGIITMVGSVAAMVAPLLGFTVDQGAVAEARGALEAISDNLTSLITLAGGALAIFGRIVAKTTIG
jgi:hypothetical protein